MTQQRVRGTRRVWLPAFFFGAFAVVIFGRLVQVQLIEHDIYAARAETERVGAETLNPPRGAILDRNGHVLATSVNTWDVYVNSRAWRDGADAESASQALAGLLQTDYDTGNIAAEQIRETVQQSKAVDVLVVRDIDYEVGLQVISAGIPGVILLSNTERVNPEGDTGASVLGFIGLDKSGLAGIEAQYEDVLRGKPGKAIYERDTTGEPIPFGHYIAMDPVRGQDLVLTIDRYLQGLVEERLAEAMEQHQARGGAIIVMNPKTGEILALATSPGLKYSTLDLSDASQMELLRNRAVTDLYEPGSVMKVITAAAAIDRGVVRPDTTYVDTGVVNVEGTILNNWRYESYGLQTMTGVLQHSINTGAVFMVDLLGAEVFHEYLEAFGFGKPTGIDLNGESGGIVRRPNDPDWSPVDLATQAFGQSISVTPMQMITAVAAVINGGELVRPHFVKAYVDSDGTRREVEPGVERRVISEEASATLRQMLTDVIGPASRLHPGKPDYYTAGGKSGTANVAVWNGYDDTQIASFVGFAPADDPEILVLVKLDENQDFETGTQAAAPVFAQLADEILQYLSIPPDDPVYVSGGR